MNRLENVRILQNSTKLNNCNSIDSNCSETWVVAYKLIRKELMKNSNDVDKEENSYIIKEICKNFQLKSNAEFLSILRNSVYQFNRKDWLFGFSANQTLPKLLKYLVKILNKLKVKILVSEAENYNFICEKNSIKGKAKIFSIFIFDNFQSYFLEFQNKNFPCLEFLMIFQKIMDFFLLIKIKVN